MRAFGMPGKDSDRSGRGRTVKVTQAYRFALDPSSAQERALRSHAGAARFAWNWGLAKCKERYQAGRAVLKQEPGTADAGQTGTAAHRAAAA